jgi:hypothetical protein
LDCGFAALRYSIEALDAATLEPSIDAMGIDSACLVGPAADGCMPPQTLTGLVPGVAYRFRVCAASAAGTGGCTTTDAPGAKASAAPGAISGVAAAFATVAGLLVAGGAARLYREHSRRRMLLSLQASMLGSGRKGKGKGGNGLSTRAPLLPPPGMLKDFSTAGQGLMMGTTMQAPTGMLGTTMQGPTGGVGVGDAGNAEHRQGGFGAPAAMLGTSMQGPQYGGGTDEEWRGGGGQSSVLGTSMAPPTGGGRRPGAQAWHT